MKNFYLLDYLNEYDYIPKDRFDLFKHELDKKIYLYGNHLKNNKEIVREELFIELLKNKIKKMILKLRFLSKNTSSNNIISNAYFNLSSELREIGFNVVEPPWNWRSFRDVVKNPFYTYELVDITDNIKYNLNNLDFYDLIKYSFSSEIDLFKNEIISLIKKSNIKAFFAPFDLTFFERFLIRICNDLNIPTFIFVHGFSGVYTNVDDSTSKYLIVFGEKIKEDYIKLGVNKDKIFVSGHPFYKNDVSKIDLKFDLENVLVLSKVTFGFPPSIEAKGVFIDRGRSILYLYSIQRILEKLGVKSVRFRPHPSENADWYMKYLDNSFFKIDKSKTLSDSINSSTLLIGPSSTVYIESLYYGVNYIVYEPTINNKDIIDVTLLSPFDGSDNRIIMAKNEKELEEIIKNKEKPNMSFFNDYMQTPFNIDFLKDIII